MKVREYETADDNGFRQHSFYFDKRRDRTVKVVLNWPKQTVTVSTRERPWVNWVIVKQWKVRT